MICVLCGGTGAAKFMVGLQKIVSADDIVAIVNTGDDLTWWGLSVSPDIDSIMYALAGILSRERGWGIEGDTFECLARMRALGEPAWFSLGDRDLATHLQRTLLIRSGRTLSEATADAARRFNVGVNLIPMSDDIVETRVRTDKGELSFQEYFVRERFAPVPLSVTFRGAECARPAPGVLDAIASADTVIIAPSNPITSIGPVLAVPAIRDALHSTTANVVAISPIVNSAAVSGPAGQLMRAHGFEISIRGVAQAYSDFLDVLVIDESDRATAASVEELGIAVHCCPTIMKTDDDKVELAKQVISSARIHEKAVSRRA